MSFQDWDVATDFHATLDTPEGRRKPKAITPKSPEVAKRMSSRQEDGEDDGKRGSYSEEEKDGAGGWGSHEL